METEPTTTPPTRRIVITPHGRFEAVLVHERAIRAGNRFLRPAVETTWEIRPEGDRSSEPIGTVEHQYHEASRRFGTGRSRMAEISRPRLLHWCWTAFPYGVSIHHRSMRAAVTTLVEKAPARRA